MDRFWAAIGEWGDYFRDAYSHKRFWWTTGISLLVFLGTTDYAKDTARSILLGSAAPTGTGATMILGVPAWAWGVMAFLSTSCIWFVQAGLRFKRALKPAIDLHFRPNAEGIVETRIDYPALSAEGKSVVVRDMATYVRITADCQSEKTIEGCAAFITKLEKGTIQGADFVDVPLNGSISLTPNPISIYPRVQNTIDFLMARESSNKLECTQPWPYRLEGTLEDEATYRFTIEVIGNGIAKSIRVLLVWTKRWNKITAGTSS